ncbi:uncharacterized [Tachysurus ichikawai]
MQVLSGPVQPLGLQGNPVHNWHAGQCHTRLCHIAISPFAVELPVIQHKSIHQAPGLVPNELSHLFIVPWMID